MLSASLVLLSARLTGLAWLALFWMVPLLFALRGQAPGRAMGYALLCAGLFWAGSVSWLVPAFMDFTDTPWPLALLLYLPLCFLMAIPYALFGYLYRYYALDEHRYGPWLAAALLTILLMLPSPIPGLPLHALHVYPRWLSLLSLSGLSALVFISSLWALLIVQCFSVAPSKRKWPAWQLLLLVVLVITHGLYWQWQYRQMKEQGGKEQWLTVGMLQPDLRRDDSTATLFSETKALIEQSGRPDLMVWPEFPPAFSIIENRYDRSATLNLSRDYDIDLMTVSGYVYQQKKADKEKRHYFNTVHLVRDGTIKGHYYKQRLVPFFEYLPWEKQWPVLRHWFPNVLRYVPGHSSQPIDYNNTIRIIPAICYEVIFPHLVAGFVRNGGNLLVNPVSDTWFGNSAGSNYHLSLAHFRSIEHRIPWLRVANAGISIAVEANGDVIKGSRTALNKKAKGSYRIFVPQERTIYSHYGDWLTPLLAIVLAVAWIIKKRGKDNAG